ncbi:MAG: pyruvate kinase [Bacteroidetes bacterium]|nr:pyruvate kinase [Bacteroidota bacterium]MBU2507399.1 pyruvate kinase [Bacteroidota bacterium]
MTRTKILATLGPASSSEKDLEKLLDAGIDGIRLNFSHGTYPEFDEIFETINRVCEKKKLPIAILVDLQGPKIRVGELASATVLLKAGKDIEISAGKILGNENIISTSYKPLTRDAVIGDKILIDDGLIELKVIEKKKNSLNCRIMEGGILKPKKGMNLPGMKLSTQAVTKKDFENLEFALKHRVDYIALSFVRDSKDISKLKKWLAAKGKKIPVIAKIEKPEAVHNFESILKEADGIMVARGDLGVEMMPYEVPMIQKKIIRECRNKGKLVITATQMLESMINNPVPTRAEASDVANAVLDGTDVVMLSAETSVGKYPSQTVKMMDNILRVTEIHEELHTPFDYKFPKDQAENLFDAAGKSVYHTSEQVKADAIVVFTRYGRKAKVISKFRPKAPIYVFCDRFETMNWLNLYWGIESFFLADIAKENKAIKKATTILKEKKLIKKGNIILFTAGAPITDKERKSWMRYVVV